MGEWLHVTIAWNIVYSPHLGHSSGVYCVRTGVAKGHPDFGWWSGFSFQVSGFGFPVRIQYTIQNIQYTYTIPSWPAILNRLPLLTCSGHHLAFTYSISYLYIVAIVAVTCCCHVTVRLVLPSYPTLCPTYSITTHPFTIIINTNSVPISLYHHNYNQPLQYYWKSVSE